MIELVYRIHHRLACLSLGPFSNLLFPSFREERNTKKERKKERKQDSWPINSTHARTPLGLLRPSHDAFEHLTDILPKSYRFSDPYPIWRGGIRCGSGLLHPLVGRKGTKASCGGGQPGSLTVLALGGRTTSWIRLQQAPGRIQAANIQHPPAARGGADALLQKAFLRAAGNT